MKFRRFLALVLLCCTAFSQGRTVFAAPVSALERDLATEQQRAEERKKSLRRLSDQERAVHADLAAAAARIGELEAALGNRRTALAELAKEDEGARIRYEDLLAEQAKTEEARNEALRLLWEITSRRLGVGNRDMADWAETDREFVWSRELLAALEGYKKDLDARETELSAVLGRRTRLSEEIQSGLASAEREKAALLEARLRYEQNLASIRRERSDTEAELQNILKLVESLNFQLSLAGGGNIEKQKGKLPRPVSGTVKGAFNPGAAPPFRGMGIACAEGAEVRAIAGGTVVHNDILRSFGTVLILRHGEDYYSLYAFLGESPLKVGDEVRARQTLGRCGYYPAVNGPGLYFELRFKQKAINPEQWLAPV